MTYFEPAEELTKLEYAAIMIAAHGKPIDDLTDPGKKDFAKECVEMARYVLDAAHPNRNWS